MTRNIFTTLALCLSLALPMKGQSLVLAQYKNRCDTLKTLIQQKTSVLANIQLKSVTRRNGTLDFHFSSGIGDIPWRKGDIEWLRKTLHEISPEAYTHYKIGTIYSGSSRLSDIAMPEAGNDGRPAEHKWRYKDPVNENGPSIVR